MQTARNRYFPCNSWELCTADSKRGREGGGLEALARKFNPVSKTYFLHTSWHQWYSSGIQITYLLWELLRSIIHCDWSQQRECSKLISVIVGKRPNTFPEEQTALEIIALQDSWLTSAFKFLLLVTFIYNHTEASKEVSCPMSFDC